MDGIGFGPVPANGRRGFVAMGAVRPLLVVELPPALDQHLRLGAAAEPFPVQQLVPQLAEAFKAENPGTTFNIAAEGSSTGFAALLDQTANIGMASRRDRRAPASPPRTMPISVCASARRSLRRFLRPARPGTRSAKM